MSPQQCPEAAMPSYVTPNPKTLQPFLKLRHVGLELLGGQQRGGRSRHALVDDVVLQEDDGRMVVAAVRTELGEAGLDVAAGAARRPAQRERG